MVLVTLPSSSHTRDPREIVRGILESTQEITNNLNMVISHETGYMKKPETLVAKHRQHIVIMPVRRKVLTFQVSTPEIAHKTGVFFPPRIFE